MYTAYTMACVYIIMLIAHCPFVYPLLNCKRHITVWFVILLVIIITATDSIQYLLLELTDMELVAKACEGHCHEILLTKTQLSQIADIRKPITNFMG